MIMQFPISKFQVDQVIQSKLSYFPKGLLSRLLSQIEFPCHLLPTNRMQIPWWIWLESLRYNDKLHIWEQTLGYLPDGSALWWDYLVENWVSDKVFKSSYDSSEPTLLICFLWDYWTRNLRAAPTWKFSEPFMLNLPLAQVHLRVLCEYRIHVKHIGKNLCVFSKDHLSLLPFFLYLWIVCEYRIHVKFNKEFI